MNLDYRVLGPIEVWRDGLKLDIGGARQRRLIGALVLAAGRPVTAERLIDVVWVGRPPEQARNTLRTYVARARRALEVDGETPLLTEPNGWRLERAADALDSARFEAMLGAARAMSADPIAALGSIEEALSLWRDDAYVEFSDEDWCTGEAFRLDERRLAAKEERFEAMLGCGLYDDAIGELEGFTERHPLRDRPRGQQMLALYRAGRQVEAVRVFQGYRRYLQDEVGVETSGELRTLEQRIVERDPSLQQHAPDGRHLRGYQLGQQIGQGAFGRIYRASQPALGREVAIKVVRPELADNPEFIRRFDGEAQIIARLEHPHIVPLFDYWREPGGAYLVMRYLKGGTAQQLLASHGPLSIRRVSRIVDEIGGALATAHAQQVVHRDVKPANILFDEHGSAYLGDFGIATGVGSMGTPEPGSMASAVYVSPEQVSQGEVSASADIYALGAVLYELLAGVPPFERETPMAELIELKRTRSLARLSDSRPDLPRALSEVIQRATAPDPTDRFAEIGEMVLAVHSAVSSTGRGPSANPLGIAARNPYKGLAAFDEADEADFCGREHLVDQLHDRISQSRFVTVVGPSGSGKSSLVRAGVAPKLRAGGSFVVTMMPGEHPTEELIQALLRVAPEAEASATRAALRRLDRGLVEAAERCLPDEPAELVVIVDQFEELFTVSGEAERDEFLHLIAGAATNDSSRVRVVATLRADFYDRPLNHGGISELVRANTVAIIPLSPVELEQAITEPALRVGVAVEPGLTAALVADFANASSGLPLVQYELTQLFEQRDGDTLTISAYESDGGLGGAIARRADELYDSYDQSGRSDIRQLFGRLVTPGEGTEDTRRRVRQSELSRIPPEVIAAYGGARLLTFDHDPETREPTVEVAHEALIQEWPRLRGWVDSDREGLRILRHVTASANEWDHAGRDPSELYRGARLLAAEEWARDHAGELSPAEQEYLDTSVEARDADKAQEQRRLRRLRSLVAALGVVAVLATVAGVVAFRQSQMADENAATAERRALENRTAQLASEAMLALDTSDPDLSILLALAAYETSTELGEVPSTRVASALHETVQASRLEQIVPAGRTQIAIDPDGRHLVLDGLDSRKQLVLYNLESGEVVAERTLDEVNGGLAYSPDGSLLAVALGDSGNAAGARSPELPALLLLDPVSLDTVQRLEGGLVTWLPSWSADSRSVLAVGHDETRMWNVDDPEAARTVAGIEVDMAGFVPGTNDIAILAGGTLEIVHRDTAEVLRTMEVPESVGWMVFSPGGTTVALVDPSGRQVQVIEFGSDEPVMTVDHPNPRDVRFSPDGTKLSLSGNHDAVRVVDLDTGEAIELRGHGTGSSEHTWSAQGDKLLAATLDGSTRVWNLSAAGPESLGNLEIGGSLAGAPQVVGESSILAAVATGSNDAEVIRFDTTTGASQPIADFWFTPFQDPVFAADGTLVAGFSPTDLVASVVEVDSGDVILPLRACETPKAVDSVNRWVLVEAACADPSQRDDASGIRRGFVDLDTNALMRPIDEGGEVRVAKLGPLGTTAEDLLVYRTRERVVFRAASTGEEITAWDIPQDVVVLGFAFSPDGTSLGASAQTREGIVFDLQAILAGAPADEAVTVFEEMSTGPTHSVAPVGNYLVTTHNGTEIRQWDPVSGDLLVDVATNSGRFALAVPMADNTTVLYSDAGGVLTRLQTNVDDLVDLARSRIQRGFTEAECGLFFPQGDCPG